MKRFDEAEINRIGAAVGEAIDLAAVGAGDWDAVTSLTANSFPGSYAAVINVDSNADRLNHYSVCNILPDYLDSYLTHYAFCNPWLPVFGRLPSGGLLISEEIAPARSFLDTEFYQDWLRPQRHYDAGAGMRIHGSPKDMIFWATHFSPDWQASYGPALAAFYRQIRGPMKRAVRLARQISDAQERGAGRGAVVDRLDRLAVVVDANLAIVDANEDALASFQAAGFMRSLAGRLHLPAAAANSVLAQSVRQIAFGKAVAFDSLLVTHGETRFLVHLASIRVDAAPGAALMPPRPLVLILARDIDDPRHSTALERFSRHHQLTPSELRFCERLAAGDSVKAAAAHLAISKNTARQRLKTIFQKTDTNRQAELMRRMLAFG
ncbi:helix-turn-helix transcriptional regulator [Pararhizobium haloflavum]|uniref:helix-turn-helix transcriptional regulator n=1 Tax=Pararhizobium haloflavum TaxID=2037914 RepID=UPI000C1931EA|nr:hypothetical protein [Pararhizobium haloflavum]